MRTRWRVFFLVLLAACGLAVPQSLLGQAPTPPANDDCLACHGDSSAVRADGRPVAVAPDAFAGSVHGGLGLSCVSCHADLATLTEYPHPDKLKPADCSSCHEAPVTQFMASAHAAARTGGNAKAATCADCHGMHDIKPASDPASRTYHLNVAATCGTCHGPSGAKTGAPAVLAHFTDRPWRNRGLSWPPTARPVTARTRSGPGATRPAACTATTSWRPARNATPGSGRRTRAACTPRPSRPAT